MERLYVVQGRNGLIKIGCTSDFKRRLVQLKAIFRRFGDEPVRHQVFAEMAYAHGAESATLRLMEEGGFAPVHGREWFAGVNFDAACEMAAKGTEHGLSYNHPARVPGANKAYLDKYRQQRITEFGGLENYEAWLSQRRLQRRHSAVCQQSGSRSFAAIVNVIIEQKAA